MPHEFTLYFTVVTTCLYALALYGAEVSSHVVERRSSLNGKHCWRYSCQVQGCFPPGDPDVKTAGNLAFCLFGQEAGQDCGAVVSGIGYPQSKAYIKCSPGYQLRQFEYTIWRSAYKDMDKGEYLLPSLDKKYQQAYGVNCTVDEPVHCDGNVSYDTCNKGAQCDSKYGIGCRVNSTDDGGCLSKDYQKTLHN